MNSHWCITDNTDLFAVSSGGLPAPIPAKPGPEGEEYYYYYYYDDEEV